MFSIIGSICIGDKTSCGGMVISGSPFTDVKGRAVARVGDKIACKQNCTIISGNFTEIIDGAAMALHGSQTSSGCICISQNNDFHGDGRTESEIAKVPLAADSGIAYMPATAELLNEDHWLEFRLTDTQDNPVRNQRYLVVDPSGAQFSGQVDENGYARVEPVKAGQCQISFPDLGQTIAVDSCRH